MATIIVVLLMSVVIGFLATSSRMIWSFARDRGMPFYRYISKASRSHRHRLSPTLTKTFIQVEPRTSIPMVAIAIVTTISCLLALIYIGSSTVFEDLVSLCTSSLYFSYLIPCTLLLYRRTTGQIQPHNPLYCNSDDNPSISQTIAHPTLDYDNEIAQPPLQWGPWRIPGALGITNNAFACLYILFVLFWSFWPPITPTNAQNMNYSVLVTGVVIAFSIVYYYVWGKAQYRGPLIEHNVQDYASKGT